MVHRVPRKTVYAATVISLLALAGGWTLAAGTTQTVGPAQNSSITGSPARRTSASKLARWIAASI